MKLFKVTVGVGGDYRESYAVADSPNDAYRQVEEFLDKEGIGFRQEREMLSIELLAEDVQYPKCGARLFPLKEDEA